MQKKNVALFFLVRPLNSALLFPAQCCSLSENLYWVILPYCYSSHRLNVDVVDVDYDLQLQSTKYFTGFPQKKNLLVSLVLRF